ncbi:MAG: 4Fe-4S dicluster domain-containing protein [Oscillospiraceae bacterium]|jgi:carbon-monoxide dehydrogenase iron sulfur subunit|nr:4Fe-4S dicluster domain-containing protein [Christensenellales bacterium]PWM07172.1 MAG: 4Fe-4S ferredoxin [Clostridiales bacterium]HIR68859.1 4Fe-4S dicluster domain-containing protein [Candidatus Pelethousia gallinarum]
MKQLVVKPEKCIGCRTCELVCSFGHYQKFSPRLSNITVLEYEAATLAVPVVCQQCEDASCMKVCPVHAISRNEDGIVTINYDACIGCRLCTNACALGNMSYSPRLRKVFKCDQCGGDPKCVRYCPGGALTYEDAGRMDPRKKLTADKIVAAMGMEV